MTRILRTTGQTIVLALLLTLVGVPSAQAAPTASVPSALTSDWKPSVRDRKAVTALCKDPAALLETVIDEALSPGDAAVARAFLAELDRLVEDVTVTVTAPFVLIWSLLRKAYPVLHEIEGHVLDAGIALRDLLSFCVTTAARR